MVKLSAFSRYVAIEDVRQSALLSFVEAGKHTLCDVFLRVPGSKADAWTLIGSNSALLRMKSSALEALWQSDLGGTGIETIDIADCSEEAIRALNAVAFGVLNAVEITNENVSELLFAALKFDFKLLVDCCKQFIEDSGDRSESSEELVSPIPRMETTRSILSGEMTEESYSDCEGVNWFSDEEEDDDEGDSGRHQMGEHFQSDKTLVEMEEVCEEPYWILAEKRLAPFQIWKRGALFKDFKAVVAIDFGTTRSGMLIALCKKGSKVPTIFAPHLRGGVDFADSFDKVKTDCSLLLDNDGGFVAYGKRARDFAKANTYTGDDSLLFFEHIKSKLHSAKDLSTAKIRAANGRTLDASVVFTRALEHLRGVAMDILKPKTAVAIERMAATRFVFGECETNFGLPINASAVRWVLTVPTIWSETAKDFMRKCALDAGLGTDSANPVLLYEAEATGIALHFHLQTSGQPQIAAGDVYLVLDCGGGTVNVVAHEWVAPFEVREVMPHVCDSIGSIRIDSEFKQLLADVFGERMAAFQRKRPSAWLRLADAFEKAKDGFRKGMAVDGDISDVSSVDGDGFGKVQRIEVCDEMVKFFTKKELKKCAEAYNRRTGESVRVDDSDDVALLISDKLMAAMLDKVIGRIQKLLEDLFARFKRALFGERKLRYVFLVGGFAESKCLEQRIGHALVGFGGVRVLVPDSPGLAVLRGAAHIEYIRTLVKARVLRRTYGQRVTRTLATVRKWAPKPHIGCERVFTCERDGRKRVRNCFQVIAQKGDCVQCGDSVTLTGFRESMAERRVAVEVYFSETHTADHLLPMDATECAKHAVGGKPLLVRFPKWFDAAKGRVVQKYTFAEECELRVEVTLHCGDRTQTVSTALGSV